MKLIDTSYSHKEAMVLKALESSKYKWRTLEGIAKDTGLTKEFISRILQQLGDEGRMLKIIHPKTAEWVYTTPDHYTRKHNFLDIILSTATGSLIF